MSEKSLFPGYIQRTEEERVREQLGRVCADHKSRAVLLYGQGGIGKTSLVRKLARESAAVSGPIWIDPVDIDDSDYWLLSNLEQHVADRLDEQGQYFYKYRQQLSKLPAYARSRVGYETVVSHLAQIKQIFTECYCDFISSGNHTVVITLDTVEAVRGMYLLVTLTQWMKALPDTLFIMSGRPPGNGKEDPIRKELQDPHRNIPVATVELSEFSWASAHAYFAESGIGDALEEEQIEKLSYLTRGHPLWMALTIDYLDSHPLPEEAVRHELGVLETELPYGAPMTPYGYSVHEEFKRRLVAPYYETDFWHEAFKRLSVARESIDEQGWRELMADRRPAAELAGVDTSWTKLLEFPWIRQRANRRYVTLHDAVAEELALRIIPLHDQGKQWRRQIWSHAAEIYMARSQTRDDELTGELARLEDEFHQWTAGRGPDGQELSAEEESRIIGEAERLEPQRRELFKLKAIWLYYELLADQARGCELFIQLMGQAKANHDILFQNLLAVEIQRFLPSSSYTYAHGDAVGEVIREFHRWLDGEGRDLYLEVGLSLANYLIKNEQTDAALALLNVLPDDDASPMQRYRLRNLRGNAYMRTPGQVMRGKEHFEAALTEAASLHTDDKLRLLAKAHKELGFYYRNLGMWQEANDAYQRAHDSISESLFMRRSDEDREEMASIQTNWAYVKGLTGQYHDGSNLAESALTIRQKVKNSKGEGNSWSVVGEVYRYQRRFQRAWEAYEEAEHIFEELRNWSWLGMVYQEQAICVFQAAKENINLVDDPGEWARERIRKALDLCRDLAVRGYPSALNRAGRIFAATDLDAGLHYLEDGIDWAYRLNDGWFRFANLIEYAELCYRAWATTGWQGYRVKVRDREPEIIMAMNDFAFPDLRGRWRLLKGHFSLQDSLVPGNQEDLENALEHYKEGFTLVAQRHVGSSGAASISGEFKTLAGLMGQLAPEIQHEWLQELRRAWTQKGADPTLLARLEELY